ncbi:hypothetical protein QUF90_05090 [Desulfococcaceae bacterium HSG9]|nr:hypothetical protein [Desulfococcaceae bacterium HSG9]
MFSQIRSIRTPFDISGHIADGRHFTFAIGIKILDVFIEKKIDKYGIF